VKKPNLFVPKSKLNRKASALINARRRLSHEDVQLGAVGPPQCRRIGLRRVHIDPVRVGQGFIAVPFAIRVRPGSGSGFCGFKIGLTEFIGADERKRQGKTGLCIDG
jgi:hypothetical protein